MRHNLGSLTLMLGLALAHLASHSVRADDPLSFEPRLDFVQLPEGLKFGAASAVAVNSRGEIFLFHRGKKPIVCVDAEGKFLRAWGDDVIDKPHGLRVDAEDNVWTTDTGTHRVLKFDREGKLLLSLGTGKSGTATDQFDRPTDIAFAANGDLFVTDGYGNSRVLKFSPKGSLITTWGAKGKERGQFNLPHAIVIDRAGRLLVGDRENNRIQIFDAEGRLLDVWPGFAPYGLALNRDGVLFVADARASQILQLDAAGKVVHRIGRKGDGVGEFSLPHMLAFDSRGNALIAEVGNSRFQLLKKR